ncbi:MAG: hypothetical protein ACR2IF_14860 [Terriglobales bacterium]
MYTGKTIDELVNMVMRAEEHAHIEVMEEPRLEPSMPRFFYDLPQSQPMHIGVA